MRKILLVLALLFTSVITQNKIDWHDMSECLSVTMVVGHECDAEKKACKDDQGCQFKLDNMDTCAQKCVDDLTTEKISEFPFQCVDDCLNKDNKNFYNLFICAKNYCTHLTTPQKLNFLEG